MIKDFGVKMYPEIGKFSTPYLNLMHLTPSNELF